MKKIFVSVSLLFMIISCAQKQKQKQKKIEMSEIKKIEKLFETVKYTNQKIYYDLKVFNGACNYKIWVNDIPVFSMHSNARGELSFPINGKILKSGKQNLKIQIFPFYDKNMNLLEILNSNAGLDIEIREMEWNSVSRKFDYKPIFTYQTPREGNKSLEVNPTKLLIDNEQPFYEEEVTFEVEVPYNLKGWSESVNLKNENKQELFKEVEKYFQELRNDFKTKKVSVIEKKYYNKEKELAQCFFHDEKKAKTRWNEDIIKEILDPNAKVGKLEEYQLKFFGNGQIVTLIRFPDETPLYLTIDDEDGSPDYYLYQIYLHRPKSGVPLEMIR